MSLFAFYAGRGMQILGMATVFISLAASLSGESMGSMLLLALGGLAEFYLGYFLVARTGKR